VRPFSRCCILALARRDLLNAPLVFLSRFRQPAQGLLDEMLRTERGRWMGALRTDLLSR
jgi:hypothetical protein